MVRDIPYGTEPLFPWDPASLYLRRPPFLDDHMDADGAGPRRAHAADARRRHHHGPHLARRHAYRRAPKPRAYLIEHGVPPQKFGTYIGRRANHEVMIRGTFANIRLRNELAPDREGGFTRHQPSGEIMTVFQRR